MKPRTRKTAIMIGGVVTLLAIAFDIFLSLDPGNYFFYRPEDRAKWVYDAPNVALVCSILLAEGVFCLVAMVSSRPRALWLRCLTALVLLGPWAVLSTLVVLHLPMYVLFHHVWVWLLVFALATTAVVSMARQLLLRIRQRTG